MLVEDALTRMDAILEMQPLPTNEVNVPKDSSVVVENIQFACPNVFNTGTPRTYSTASEDIDSNAF